ncbi:MAG: acyltransferase domain-containing protein, partial [Planctomycetales bacterium]|nr:acyltransferase domain-containing protein [Planctomycetales bacterium]
MTTTFQPIAIVGIGCRFPGQCNDPESFWRLLESAQDAITMTPKDRWNLEKYYAPGHARPGKTQSKWGGYIDGIDEFDPQLFGISPREAACMDPQQRMLLETAYRAIEDAGVPIESLAGQPISVHVGISGIDYSVASLSHQDRGVIGPYSNTGGSSSIAANRISYCFDLRGESIAVDTACSSSLIATHLACQSLQNQANKMALAGGVNALIMPDFYVAFSQLGVLSPDGRCKTFDASANGYVRSEGAGMVLLKRLDDAIVDGDSIYAVIHGSATNQDGRTKGLTVPSQSAQQVLIETALATAGVRGHDISYVEAHGTGTPIGDPIEARAIARCYGRLGADACRIGSVKTNIGHLEAGAGIASVIKVALAMTHRKIPAHLNYQTPNPQIDFDQFGLRVPTSTQAWDAKRQRMAGINGFGYGGANVHLILGEAPASSGDAPSARQNVQNQFDHSPIQVAPADAMLAPDVMMLPISAHDSAALGRTAGRWANWLIPNNDSIADVVANACHRRSHHDWRAAVVGNNRGELAEQLRQIADDPDRLTRHVHAIVRGRESNDTPKVAFVCSGQGPQWWAMGRGMLERNQVFRDVIDRCEAEFAKHVSWSLREELSRGEDESRMQETSIAQPCLFALQVALAAVWKSKGIVPSVVTGHSVGEIAAACLSGALCFSDACLVAIHRGRTMDAASSKGAMIAVGLSVDETEVWIQDIRDRVSIAAVNGPCSLTVSGCATAIDDLQQRLDRSGVFCRRLQVEYAFHSPQMDPVRDELLRSLDSICPSVTTTTMISTVSGDIAEGTELGADYWWKNVRQRVRFADAMDVLAAQQVDIAIEIGPHPVLAYAIAECYSANRKTIFTIPSLRRDTDDAKQMQESLGKLYTWGYPIDWNLNAPAMQRRIKLPPLSMNKQSLWAESHESRITRIAPEYDPVLGDPVDGPGRCWQTHVDLRVHESLADHRVRNSCVMPAATMLQFAVAAAKQVTQSESVSLRGFSLQNPCLLSDDTPIRLQVGFDKERRQINLATCGVDDSDWQPLATVDLASTTATGRRTDDPNDLQKQLSDPVSAERVYAHCERLGLNYGRRFRGVSEGYRKPNEAVVTIDLPCESLQNGDAISVSSALLDSCFHGMIVADPDFEDTVRGLYLPQRIDSLDIFSKGDSRLTAHVRIVRKDDYRMVANIDIYDDSKQHCIAIRGFESVRVSGTSTKPSTDELLYRYVWKPADRSGSTKPSESPRKWLVFSDQSGTGMTIVDRFPVNDQVITVQHGTSFKRLRDDSFIIEPDSREQFDRLLTDVGNGVSDIVYLWGLDSPENVELSSDTLDKSTLLTTLAPLHLAAAWQAAADANLQTTVARLSIVTRDSQPPDDTMQAISIASGPLVGFGRVIASECARLSTKLIDFQSDQRAPCAELMRELVERCDREDEVMIRDSIRWVRRFVPANEQPLHPESSRRLPAILRPGDAASIDQLRYETMASRALQANEVEIEILSTGLNFSDVMKSLDLYPGLPDGPALMGAECCGRVHRIGSDVVDFSVGDEVIAVAPGSFATHVIVNASLVAKKPKSLSHDQAATIPIAFLTAQYALDECARIRPGERVLIHAASGGVGIAATQLARLAGATVLATAGTDAKRQFVRKSGVDYVMDSRTLDFARHTLEHTDGEGVDVVLNSLPGEAIKTGLSILRTGGRFLEIGKRDIYSDNPL